MGFKRDTPKLKKYYEGNPFPIKFWEYNVNPITGFEPTRTTYNANKTKQLIYCYYSVTYIVNNNKKQ